MKSDCEYRRDYMTDNTIERRQMISILGGAGTAAIAGCGGSDDVDVPDPEQEEDQGQNPEQQQTQEQEDELQKAPFEDRLEPSYAEQHEEAMQDVNQYTVDVISKESVNEPILEGTVKVNEDTDEILAEFELAANGGFYQNLDTSVAIYRRSSRYIVT